MRKTLRRYPNHLRALRRIRGYRQKTVAHLLGQANTDMVSAYERGLVLPPLRTALKLTVVLKVQLSELYPHLLATLEQDVGELLAQLPKGSRRPLVAGRKETLTHDST